MTEVRRATRTALAALAALAGVACRESVDTAWHEEQGVRWRSLDVPRRGAPGFTAMTASRTGLVHANDVADEHALSNRNLLLGAGVALGDIDEDGLPDVFLASVERPAALYHNDGDFHFTDITAASGIETAKLATLSAAFSDVDGDGHLDLLVGTLGGPLLLWKGNGRGQFADATAASGLAAGYAATALTLADVDGDGDLDLYVGTYKTHNTLDTYPPQELTFDKIVRKVGNRYEVDPRWAADYRIQDRPDLGAIMRSQRAEPDLFFLNDGRGHFSREPVAGPRFLDEHGKPLDHEPDHFTLAARFYDVNGDGANDLYVCNDFEDPDEFWLNDGTGHFRLAPALAMRESSNTCMSVDFGDVNRDGHVDFFTADMMSVELSQRQRQIATNTMLPKPVGLPAERQQWMRNMLQLARGDGTWADISLFAGVGASEWTWGSAFIDVDLDGFEDLLVANGHRWDVRDADTYEHLRTSVPRVPWNREQGEFPRHDAQSMAFRNTGTLGFVNANRSWRFGADSAISNGLALADLDGDGDLDVVVTRLDAPPAVYRTSTPAPRVAVRLHGAPPNVYGIGATVTLRAASLPVQTRQLMPTGLYLSGSDAALAFATGRDTAVTIDVRWPDGRTSSVPARPNRLYEIHAPSSTPAVTTPVVDSSGVGLFEDATALLGGHVHVDSAFDDFRRQPLLPNKLSQLGPGLSWIDVDGDAREDLVVGTGRGGRVTVLRNRGGRFVPSSLGNGPARWDVTTILPALAGPTRAMGGLIAGQSSYEASSAGEALSVATVTELSAAQPSAAPTPVLPPDTGSVGPLASGDVDGDGRLDLFVGARVVPGAWPVPARSHLYRAAANGGWVADTVNDHVVAASGLASGALFSDLDGDGRPELVTTSEWGPVRVFHNDAGRLRDATAEWGLSELRSRWNGLAAGDFDGNGKMDLVVTSWGRNTPWEASVDRPYVLITGNFGGAGLGLLFARYDSAAKREMPLESFDRVGLAVPSLRTRFSTRAAFARASVDDILGESTAAAIRVGATTFDHVVLLNDGGRFRVASLPPAAQLAPAFAAVVADYDGDGREDLFLAQNFSPTALETPRFDAGAGLVLLGDGRGGFRPLSVRQSGIAVLGDQRGAAAADYDGDGRVDLAVSQNGAATTLWHNRGAKPGLRVRLSAGAGNPWGIGAQIAISAAGRRGPARELHAGSGYWSMDAATTILALPAGADSLVIRWPGGREQVMPIRPGQTELTVSAP